MAKVCLYQFWKESASSWLSPQALGEQFYLVNNLFYLACMVPLAAWLAWTLFGRRSEESLPGLHAGAQGLTRDWIREPQSSAL